MFLVIAASVCKELGDFEDIKIITMAHSIAQSLNVVEKNTGVIE